MDHITLDNNGQIAVTYDASSPLDRVTLHRDGAIRVAQAFTADHRARVGRSAHGVALLNTPVLDATPASGLYLVFSEYLNHGYIHTTDNEIMSMGHNNYGQLGRAAIDWMAMELIYSTNLAHVPGLTGITQAVALENAGLFLRASGEVYGCGDFLGMGDHFGVDDSTCNLTRNLRRLSPELPPIALIRAPVNGAIAPLYIGKDGVVYRYTEPDNDRTDLGLTAGINTDFHDGSAIETPFVVDGGHQVRDVGTTEGEDDYAHFLITKDQGVYALNSVSGKYEHTSALPDDVTEIVTDWSGTLFDGWSYALTESGDLYVYDPSTYAWGKRQGLSGIVACSGHWAINSSGDAFRFDYTLGAGTVTQENSLPAVTAVSDFNSGQGEGHVLFIAADKTVYSGGTCGDTYSYANFHPLGRPGIPGALSGYANLGVIPTLSGIVKAYAVDENSYFIDEDDNIYVCGPKEDGAMMPVGHGMLPVVAS
jgi:hypothetical protein